MRPCRARFLFSAALLLAALPLVAGEAALWDHRPAKIVQTSDANFPPALSNQGVLEGEVRAVLNVDADGRLVDSLITAYTHVELAAELLPRLREWRYEPAVMRGTPVNARFEVNFGFKASGAVISMTAVENISANAYRMLNARLISTVCRPDQLDQPLKTTQLVPPLHPGRTIAPPQSRGSVVLEFFVDVEGRPRIPVVARMTHEAFGHAAVAALEQWRFAPPKKGGQPTMVRVTQEFVFAEPKPPST